MTDWDQLEYAEVARFSRSNSALKSAIKKFCREAHVRSLGDTATAIRNGDELKARGLAYEAELFLRFLQRLEAEVSSYERSMATLADLSSDAGPTRDDE